MTGDKKRIVELLCGRVVRDSRGRPQVVHLKQGSAEELEARRALARLLRTSLPLDPGVRFVIADLFDPDRDEIDRQIRFVNRRKGKPSNAMAEKEIAELIWSRRRAGAKLRLAVKEATKKFDLKRSRVLAIWKHWRPILSRLKRESIPSDVRSRDPA